MHFVIREIRREDAPSYREALDEVCRERLYLAGLAAPPLKMTRTFVEGNIARDNPHFVATIDGRVVGWCDAIPGAPSSGMSHVARMGMGVQKAYRSLGIGRRLMEAVIAKARRKGIEKIELGVYASNRAALALYRSAGFAVEGKKVRARLVDGVYDDVLLMGLFLGKRESAKPAKGGDDRRGK
jgi:ribosomal protein S18 acetylase RimI-like enzyme